MAAGPIIAPLPQISLGPGYYIVLEAIDPTTGATVAGVTISDATIYAGGGEGSEGDFAVSQPSYLFVPLGSESG